MRSPFALPANLLVLLALTPALGFAQVEAPGTGMSSHSRLGGGTRAHYIVQSRTTEAARESVERVGGGAGQELAIIKAVAADLSADPAAALRSITDVH